MSQVRTEKVEISPEDFESVVEACQDAGYEAKIRSSDKSKFRYYTKNGSGNYVEVTGHGVQTWGEPVIEIHQDGDGVEFFVDLHADRAKNNAKFIAVKSNIHAHYQKNKAIKAAKKMGFTVAQNDETEDKITIKVRKFI